MLNRKVGSLRISQSQKEGNPLLILEGYSDKESADYLLNLLLSFLRNGSKTVFLDIKKLHVDIKGNMAISKAHSEYFNAGSKLVLIKNTVPVSKAMRIMQKKYFADSF